MKIIKDKYEKKEIQNLPRALFEGRIVTIISEREANAAVRFLLSQDIIGLDTETRPSFKKGRSYQVALLQVSTHDTCFLFRLNRIGLCPALRSLLEDCSVLKVGLSLHDDFRMLNRRGEFTPGRHAELQQEVKKLGIQDMSLQKIYANIFGEKIAKNQQLSNWEADVLTEAQQRYAATDAWACIKIYEEIQRLQKCQNYVLEITPEPETEPEAVDEAVAKE